jgi:hypothetical protein
MKVLLPKGNARFGSILFESSSWRDFDYSNQLNIERTLLSLTTEKEKMPALLEPTLANGNGNGVGSPQDQAGTPSRTEYPVLIVGGGPTGLLSAYMLSRLGSKLLLLNIPSRCVADICA